MRIFRRINIDTHYSVLTTQRVTVSWAMEPSFIAPGPWAFTLERGYAPTETQWEEIASTVDQPWLYDNRPVVNKVGVPIYYRIKLVDGKGEVYYSQIQTTKAYWGRYDWTLAREIIRKETLLLRKKTGVTGFLLKRRYFGTPCPDCIDPATLQVQSSNCATCFGTGVVGGYYPPFEYWVTMNATQRMRRLTPEQGLMTTTIESVRALAYPVVEGNDVWVHGETNTRYFIGQDMKAIARHRGIDLIMDLVLNEAPADHIIYQVPVVCSP